MLLGWAPCPTSAMIGPWCDGSLLGFAALNATAGAGRLRSAAFVSVPRHAVSAVATRSWKWFGLLSQGDVAPGVRARAALMKCRIAIGSASPFVPVRARPPIVFWSSPRIRPNV